MADIVDRLMDATDRDANSDAIEEIVALRAEVEMWKEAARPVPALRATNERLRAALGGMLRAVCGHDGFAAAIRQTSGMMYPWPALDAAEREARAALAQEKSNG
jgi:hypothetical protein